MSSIKISKHLTLGELTKSMTAFRRGINNDPSEEVIENLRTLANELFEPLRGRWEKPLYISSGYRSVELNRAIGGSGNSQHCKGEAIDIDMDHKNSPITNADIFHTIREHLPFDQLIWEFGSGGNPAWVHVSYKDGHNRKQVLRAVRQNGKTSYYNWTHNRTKRESNHVG